MNSGCTVAGCGRPIRALGMCGGHYQRARKGQDLTTPLRSPHAAPAACSVDACDRPVRSAGLCSSHYGRQWRGQDLAKPFRETQPRGLAATRDDQGRKQCRDCRRWLPETDFHRHPRTTDGRRAHCIPCGVTLQRLYKYGLTPEAYGARFAAQDHRCAICRTDDPGRNWCVDHDHACCPSDRTCGQCVRGILCDPCNVGLARFRDSVDLLRAAAAYLTPA